MFCVSDGMTNITDSLDREGGWETEEPEEWKSSRPDLWGGRQVIGVSTRKATPTALGNFSICLSHNALVVWHGVLPVIMAR